MALLNDMDKIYAGGQLQDAVYLGADKIWPSGFDPDSLTGLVSWLDASQLGLANNAAVSPWPNLATGPQPTMVGTPAPVFKTNVLNGLPVVRFTYLEGRLRCAWTDPVHDWTVVYLVRWIGPNYGRAFTVQYPPSNLLVGMHTAQADTMYDNGTWVGTPISWTAWASSPPGPWRMYEADCANGVSSRFFQNGTLMGTAAGTNLGGITGGWAISGYDATGSGESIDAEVAELLIYNRKLPDAERIQVEDYLQTKWGL
jgi:hypothetical protein